MGFRFKISLGEDFFVNAFDGCFEAVYFAGVGDTGISASGDIFPYIRNRRIKVSNDRADEGCQ